MRSFINRNSLIIIVLIGILIRLIYQFIWPSYNYDEIRLGINIKNRSFIQLLYPLDDNQSAPPLFLITHKLFYYIKFIPIIYRFKLFSFIVSTLILIKTYNILQTKHYHTVIKILIITCFSFSPFLVYISLALKQYGLDLLGLLFTYDLINNQKRKNTLFLIFFIWPLFSNIGLFFATAYTVIDFVKKSSFKLFKIQLSWKSLQYSFGSFLYFLYFLWYLQQRGADQIQHYMLKYWHQNFIPFDTSISKYAASLIYQLSHLYFSSFHFIGYFSLFVFLIYGFYIFYTQKLYLKLSNIYLLGGIGIHLIINAFKLYPFSDRLLIYLTLPIYFGFGFIIQKSPLKKIFVIPFALNIISWMFYLPHMDNNLIKLESKINKHSPNGIVVSKLAKNYFKLSYAFTEYKLNFKFELLNTIEQIEDKKGYIYVSRVFPKFGHSGKTGPKERITNDLLSLKKISLLEKIDGYDIYRVE